MKPLVALALISLCSLSSCYIRQTSPLEPFVLSGHVSDCTNGHPIEGLTVRAYAKDNGGLFSFSAEAGTSTTDADGNFSFIPYEYSATVDFTIVVSNDSGHSDQTMVSKAEILESGSKNFMVDALCIRP